jgi:hypothetical protein
MQGNPYTGWQRELLMKGVFVPCIPPEVRAGLDDRGMPAALRQISKEMGEGLVGLPSLAKALIRCPPLYKRAFHFHKYTQEKSVAKWICRKVFCPQCWGRNLLRLHAKLRRLKTPCYTFESHWFLLDEDLGFDVPSRYQTNLAAQARDRLVAVTAAQRNAIRQRVHRRNVPCYTITRVAPMYVRWSEAVATDPSLVGKLRTTFALQVCVAYGHGPEPVTPILRRGVKGQPAARKYQLMQVTDQQDHDQAIADVLGELLAMPMMTIQGYFTSKFVPYVLTVADTDWCTSVNVPAVKASG